MKIKGGFTCPNCGPVVGVKSTHRARGVAIGLTAFGTAGLSLLASKCDPYICPHCGTQLSKSQIADFKAQIAADSERSKAAAEKLFGPTETPAAAFKRGMDSNRAKRLAPTPKENAAAALRDVPPPTLTDDERDAFLR